MHKLTRKQQEILDFLLNSQDSFRHPPWKNYARPWV